MDLLKDHIDLRILFEILPENGLAMSDCHIWFQLGIRVVRCWSRGFKGGTVGIKLWRIAPPPPPSPTPPPRPAPTPTTRPGPRTPLPCHRRPAPPSQRLR